MKKLLLSIVMLASIGVTQAQTKVSKNTVVGKWSLSAINMEGMFYYDIDKDSLALGETIMTQLTAAGQDSAGSVDMMKGQLGAIKEMGFEFNADGTYKANGTPQGPESGTFTVDEATETITMSNKKEDKSDFASSFKDGKLVLNVASNGQMPKQVLILKPAKD